MAVFEGWSNEVTKRSNAYDLEPGVFTWDDFRRIAESLKQSAEISERNKARTAYQSAILMLNFYINRTGKNLMPSRRPLLERTKVELRRLFGRK